MVAENIPNDKKTFMRSLDMPIIEDFYDLADQLRLSRKLVYWLTKEDADGKYKSFFKKKKNGKERRIDAPVASLKTAQRWVLKRILYKIKCSEYSYGFIHKKGISKVSPQLEVANKHHYNIYLLKLDIQDFYPSIKRTQVFYQFREIGYPTSVSNYLANICTWEGILPQGAPTSAYLSNLICRKLDRRIAGYCNKNNIVYTRYADDLMFSSDDRDLLHKAYNVIKDIVEDEGFHLNNEKTNFVGKSKRKEVLGITINDKLVKSPKDMKRNVRAMIHRAIATGDYSDKNKIEGYISYIKSIEGDYEGKIRKYILKLSQSELELNQDLVEAYNTNKIFQDLPDMNCKSAYERKMGPDESDIVQEEHYYYLVRMGKITVNDEASKNSDSTENIDGSENPFDI